jgi:hypothetical protein
MGKNYSKAKGRGEKAKNFAGIDRNVMESDEYIGLSYVARAVLQELAYQYNGRNNGDLTLARSLMAKRGIKKDALDSAKKELLKADLVRITRKGQFQNPGGLCDLFALTWRPINECGGKLDVKPTTQPPRIFKGK